MVELEITLQTVDIQKMKDLLELIHGVMLQLFGNQILVEMVTTMVDGTMDITVLTEQNYIDGQFG
jgi:hypothetical protein